LHYWRFRVELLQQSWQCTSVSLGICWFKGHVFFQMAKYSRIRIEANKNTNMDHNLRIMCRSRRMQAASSAIYSIEMAFNKAKLARSKAIIFISRPKRAVPEMISKSD
jgi:hypothetical protein